MIMKKTHYIALLIAICVGLFSCARNSETDPITVIQLEEDLELHLWQNLTEQGAVAQLKLVTTDLYECAEAKIVSELNTEQKSIHLELKSIQQPDNCETSTAAYITQLHPIDITTGQYDLRITLGDIISNEGKLDFSDEKVEITLNTSNGLKHSNSTMQRIPDNTAWGYLNDPNLKDELIAEMLNNVNQNSMDAFAFGDYTYFSLNPNGAITIKEQDNQQAGFVLHYTDNSDWDQILTNLSNLNSSSSTEFFVQNFDGRSIKN